MALLARYMDSLIESLIAGKYLPTNPCVVKKVYASSLPRAKEKTRGRETCWPLRVEEKGEEEKKSRRRMDE